MLSAVQTSKSAAHDEKLLVLADRASRPRESDADGSPEHDFRSRVSHNVLGQIPGLLVRCLRRRTQSLL